MIGMYDITRKTETMEDGVPAVTWSVVETRELDVQSLRWYKTEQMEVELAGQRYVPTFRGYIDVESTVTASDRLTGDSGTTNMLVLRTHEFESHKELDLRQVH